jgi:two-component system response regulator PhoP
MTELAPVVVMVEDEKQIRRFVRTALESEGIRLFEAETGRQGLTEAATRKPDLVILDLGLPDFDGVDFIRELRTWSALPVIVLSARTDEVDKIEALDAGADDYLTKPFEMEELLARLKALLRRAAGAAQDVLHCGPITLNVGAQKVAVNGEETELTSYEYRLLEHLVRERRRVLSKDELAAHLYPHDEERDSNVIEVLIGRLRRKRDPDGKLQPIETLRGRGYRFTLGD